MIYGFIRHLVVSNVSNWLRPLVRLRDSIVLTKDSYETHHRNLLRRVRFTGALVKPHLLKTIRESSNSALTSSHALTCFTIAEWRLAASPAASFGTWIPIGRSSECVFEGSIQWHTVEQQKQNECEQQVSEGAETRKTLSAAQSLYANSPPSSPPQFNFEERLDFILRKFE